MSWSMRRAVLIRPSSFCSDRSMATAASFTSSDVALRSDSSAWRIEATGPFSAWAFSSAASRMALAARRIVSTRRSIAAAIGCSSWTGVRSAKRIEGSMLVSLIRRARLPKRRSDCQIDQPAHTDSTAMMT